MSQRLNYYTKTKRERIKGYFALDTHPPTRLHWALIIDILGLKFLNRRSSLTPAPTTVTDGTARLPRGWGNNNIALHK